MLPTSPLTWAKLLDTRASSLPEGEDKRTQHLIHILNSFRTEDWLGLLALFHSGDYGRDALYTICINVQPVPFQTLSDLERIVADPRLLYFSRKYYVEAREILKTVSEKWLEATAPPPPAPKPPPPPVQEPPIPEGTTLADLGKGFKPGKGRGRPTDESWEIRVKIPMSREHERILKETSKRIGITYTQLAARVIMFFIQQLPALEVEGQAPKSNEA